MTLDPPLPRCNPVEDVVLTPGGRWRNKLTKAVPAVLHFNGGGKAYHLKMEGKMWYKQVCVCIHPSFHPSIRYLPFLFISNDGRVNTYVMPVRRYRLSTILQRRRSGCGSTCCPCPRRQAGK